MLVCITIYSSLSLNLFCCFFFSSSEAKNEATISINRRDWAFSERDKIVQERESIRRQCDELRRERDRAVSNHAEELRTLDELKRFKIATDRELQEMRWVVFTSAPHFSHCRRVPVVHNGVV